jgi:hypothetical protein
VETPDVTHSKRNLDFGAGFYLTIFPEQAERWAKRKALRAGGSAIISVYELDLSKSSYNILEFGEKDDEAWVEFVCTCRRGGDGYKKYDIIIGSVADDKVYTAVDMYFRGIWDMARTLAELKFFQRNDQICIVSQNVITESLKFTSSYEVG